MTDRPSPSPLQQFSDALAALASSVAPVLVSVRSHRSRASGFLWRPGLVVTAEEALAEEGEVTVELAGGEEIPAKIAGRDPTTDVALLRIERTNLPQASLASTDPAAGALALVVGAVEGAPLAALGIVSRVGPAWRSMRGGEIDARIELALSLRRQAEGGLVLDAGGHAFGMAVLGPNKRVLVIPTPTIERVADRLAKDGRIARGYLGLGLRPVAVEGTPGQAGSTEGAMVMSVDPQGPGAAAGFRQGDVIVAWSGQPIGRLHSILRSLGPDSVGRTIAIGLKRAGEAKQLSLTIGERPAA
jgi:S1-C subfamily serine protease